LERSGGQTLYNCKVNNIAISVFKVINDLFKPVRTDFYIHKENNYSLRNVKNLVRPNVNSITFGRNSLRYEGVVIWENLPNYVKNIETLESFKTAIKKIPLRECDCNKSNCIKCTCQVP
jgi:accessory colonization factor AcfC